MSADDAIFGWPSEDVMTISTGLSEKTIKTDKTDLVGNRDFLRTVFPDLDQSSQPVVVSFSGSPAHAPGRAWFGTPWVEQKSDTLAESNNYFSLATFQPDETGRTRRRKSSFHSLYAVMLDDIGTKVAMERLSLPVSWLLETSPGNHQAGYLLREPLTDGVVADSLMNAIVAAGLCDPGANGPCSRLARLPVGANGKYTPPFRCRMVVWSPDLRYSVEELINGLEVELVSARRPTRQKALAAQSRPSDDDPVWIPITETNSVLVALQGRGLYKEPLTHGKHDITCPWVIEHTDAVNSGTAYFEPDDDWPLGGFKCLHGHCAARHISDLLRFLDVKVSAARMKPTIRVVPGEIHRVVDAAERALANTQRYFQKGGLIVSVVTDPGTHETRVLEVGAPALVRALAGVAAWEKMDARSGNWVRVDPPGRHATVLFDSIDYHHLPVLSGLTRQPYLRPDGSVMTTAGYDRSSRMFGVFNPQEFEVPDAPTLAEAKTALASLQELLSEFSFMGPTDLAASLSALLTAAVRPSLAHAPMFHVRAHMVGSGKSYLCELVTAFATPQRGTPATFPADDEECRKLLLAELLRVPAVIEFDNLNSDLVAHKSLCTALSSENMTGRILGVSKTATVSTRTLFLSSGNNVGPIQDMARRCVTIRLDPVCELPASRRFNRPNLVTEVLSERGRYVSAALTVIRAWIVAGQPRVDCRALAGFAEWSDLCRQPLLWLGFADPTDSIFEAISEDPDRDTLGRFLSSWQCAFGTAPALVRDAVRRAMFEEHAGLREVIRDIADERGEINRRRLGWWISRHAGRVVDGRRFVRNGGAGGAESWRIEQVSQVLQVFSESPKKNSNRDTTVSAANEYARASRGQ